MKAPFSSVLWYVLVFNFGRSRRLCDRCRGEDDGRIILKGNELSNSGVDVGDGMFDGGRIKARGGILMVKNGLFAEAVFFVSEVTIPLVVSPLGLLQECGG